MTRGLTIFLHHHPLIKDDFSLMSTKSLVLCLWLAPLSSRVLLVDDLVATGGTLLAGIELVKQLGGVSCC